LHLVTSTERQPITVGRVVDWEFAATTGERLSRPGPASTAYTRRQIVGELADASRSAELPVRDVTRLVSGADVPDALIVDRAHWVRLAAESMRVMTGGDGKSADASSKTGIGGVIRGRITGAQTGAVLAFVASGILGQYDPFLGDGGKLLLVYPNIIAVERQLGLVPKDFRLWVCLHEVTHRVQFTANPWLADHMSSALGVITQDAGEDVGAVIGRLAAHIRERRDGDPAADPNSSGMIGLLRAMQSEPQRHALDQLLVLGTLLEGHADHVMDAVGPAVVPTVSTIRARFDARRKRRQPPLQRLIRALLGFDAKMNQYTRGKAFVDEVVSRVGMDRFNAIWTGPDTLPMPEEIDKPARWIDRVL
jgi:coenzyme F420 biosynthesis associated uncharacterized protein